MRSLFIPSVLCSLMVFPCFAEPRADFDINGAIQAAGGLMEPGKTEMNMRVVPPGSDVKKTGMDIAVDFDELKVPLVVIGPDYTLNYLALKEAFRVVPKSATKGATVIFVGSPEHFEELTKLAIALGITFRATTYPKK